MFNNKTLMRAAVTLLLSLLTLSEVFAQVTPIPGIGLVVRRNPGSASKVISGKDGSFSLPLEVGDYTLTPDKKVLTSVLGAFIKKNPNIIKFDNAGVEITLDNTSNVTVKYRYPIVDDAYRTSKTAVEIFFTVPEEGAKVSGKLNWNDGINSPILPNNPLGSVQ